jgi:Ca2+-binding EF-hand superfamily protein
MDEMDMILMQPSHDKDDLLKISNSFSYSSPRSHQTEHKSSPLKFHLNTTDSHGGYLLSLSQLRIRHFRKLLETCQLNELDAETACNYILQKGSRSKISKEEFQEVLQKVLPPRNSQPAMEQTISDVFSGIYAAFDRKGKDQASALEVAAGFTVLCRGKKSDKLEFAFEVLDKNKRGRVSKADMAIYLQSFLTVLLCIAFSSSLDSDPVDDSITTMTGTRCDRSTATLIEAVKAGAEWAASLAFRDFDRTKKQTPSMSFDDFADWYTAVGYSSIPWLELLDLQKWAMNNESK